MLRADSVIAAQTMVDKKADRVNLRIDDPMRKRVEATRRLLAVDRECSESAAIRYLLELGLRSFEDAVKKKRRREVA